MKLRISIILSTILVLMSCQRDEADVQTIDQVLKLYISSAATGQDLLNPNIQGSYSTPTLLDLLGVRDQEPISGFTFPRDADTLVYMDYPAGAIRLKNESLSNDNEQIYYSRFIIRLPRTINEIVVNDDDTIKIEYKSTPSLFQISKLWYNGELKFTKTQAGQNIVRIVK